MKKLLIASAAVVMMSAGLAQAADPEAYVEYRMNGMKAVGAHMKAIAGKMKTGIEVPDQTAVHAAAIAGIMESFPAAFPDGTQGVADTKAKDAVWADMDDFKAKAMKSAEAAKALVAAAESGAAMPAMGEAVGALGGTCKACHDDYKSK